MKDRRGGKHGGMCCFSPGFNSFFVVPLSLALHLESFSISLRLLSRSGGRDGKTAGRVLEGMKMNSHVTPVEKRQRREDENLLLSGRGPDPVCVRAVTISPSAAPESERVAKAAVLLHIYTCLLRNDNTQVSPGRTGLGNVTKLGQVSVSFDVG